jgi:hypothetical protein
MSDAVLQDLIVRMAADPAFADQVRANPALLSSYELTDGERQSLASLSADAGAGASGLAQRQSKSSLFFTGMPHDVGAHGVQTHVELGTHGPTPHTPVETHLTPHGPEHGAKWEPSVGDKWHGGVGDKWHPGVGDKWVGEAGHMKIDPGILGGAKFHPGEHAGITDGTSQPTGGAHVPGAETKIDDWEKPGGAGGLLNPQELNGDG